jgi:hypothetical protein
MSEEKTKPPGEHPLDPYIKDIDPVAFALNKVYLLLRWIEDHRASFEAYRASDPQSAERELEYLADATHQATQHIARLKELLLAGYTINPNKPLPRDMR